MAWTPPKELRKCPYHPDIDLEWIQKHAGKTRRSKLIWVERCEECEWNPPDISSDLGRTSPDIKHHLDRLDNE